MKPNYVVTKSVASVLSFWRILSCIFIIPIFVLVFRIMAVKRYRIEFYDDRIITYGGLLNTYKRQTVFMGVLSTSITQTLMGRIFNYGNVMVDCAGKWDIDTTYIKNPYGLEEYLQTRIIHASQVNQHFRV